MPSVDTESVLRFIRNHGPVLPMQIAKEIKQNSMMAGAVLSEMVSSGKLRVSKIKVGGSPLYYPPGQESRLMLFTQHLDSKDRLAYELLRQKGILQDSSLDPLTRVSLRSIKDFATPMNVTLDGTKELFWKWYMLTDNTAEEQIKKMLGIISAPHTLPESPEAPTDPSPTHDLSSTRNPSSTQRVQETEHLLPSQPLKPPQLSQSSLPSSSQSHTNFISGKEYDEESRVPAAQLLENSELGTYSPPLPPTHTPHHIQSPSLKRKTKAKEQTDLGTIFTPPALKPPSLEPPLPSEYASDPLYRKIQAFFESKSITIHSVSCIKKGTEFELVISSPSPLGPISFYAKAINKKRINDADLTTLFLHSQLNHLPGLLITQGQLTKSAQNLLSAKLKGLTITPIQ